jgi:hypothetical protein
VLASGTPGEVITKECFSHNPDSESDYDFHYHVDDLILKELSDHSDCKILRPNNLKNTFYIQKKSEVSVFGENTNLVTHRSFMSCFYNPYESNYMHFTDISIFLLKESFLI